MVHQAGRCCAHGGLIIYIHNELEHTVLSEIDTSSTGWEYLCVQVRGRKQGSKNIHFVIHTELPARLSRI